MRVAQPLRTGPGVLQATSLRWLGPGQGWRLLGYVTMAVAVVLVGLPMYWMFIAAFKTNQEIFTSPPTWIPLAPTLDNFPAAWRQSPFGNFYINSLLYTLVSGSAKILQAVFSAYAFAFLRFPRKNLVFVLLLMALMIPDEFTVLPNFLTLALVGWTNTYQGLLLPGFVSAFGTFLLRQHFLSLPREVLDAARVDGASYYRIYWNIMLPLARPALLVVAVFEFQAKWNDFMGPLIYVQKPELVTLPLGLQQFVEHQGYGQFQWELLFAASVLVTLPMIILYFLTQKQFVQGIATTGIKG